MFCFKEKPLILSIGGTCAVKYQIQKWVPKYSNNERFFFDYVESNFDTVLDVFGGDVVFSKETCHCNGEFKFATGRTGKSTACMVLDCGVTSIHDIEFGYSEKEYTEFLNSLRRRFMRSTSVLYMDKPVFLVHLARDNKPLENNKVMECLRLWEKLNKNHRCILVDCFDSSKFEADEFVADHFIRFPLKMNKEQANDNWKKDMFAWKQVFTFLKKYKTKKVKVLGVHEGIV